jgi:hypothetical protein
MAIDPLCSVVLNYNQDSQRLNVQLIEPHKLASLLAGKFTVPILLDDFNFELDDEFARRLGIAMLNAIALGQPGIKQYMTVTQDPSTNHRIDNPPLFFKPPDAASRNLSISMGCSGCNGVFHSFMDKNWG